MAARVGSWLFGVTPGRHAGSNVAESNPGAPGPTIPLAITEIEPVGVPDESGCRKGAGAAVPARRVETC